MIFQKKEVCLVVLIAKVQLHPPGISLPMASKATSTSTFLKSTYPICPFFLWQKIMKATFGYKFDTSRA